MKYKKYNYILIFILMLIIGINNVYAEESKTCYYISSDNNFKASLKMSWGYPSGLNLRTLNDYVDVSVDKIGDGVYEFDAEVIANWTKADGFQHLNNWYDQCTKGNGVCFQPYYQNEKEANNATTSIMSGYTPKTCPKYIVFQSCSTYYAWATESESIAKNAVKDAQNSGCSSFYASYQKNGKPITSKEYYDEFIVEGLIDYDPVKEIPDCSDYEAIFGNKNEPDSIRYMINDILGYIRILVPILIILLGTLDFAKAVLAGKQDNMKKAQSDFVKRLIAGIAVFLVPTLVNIVMDLADIVWQGQYPHCNL